ncbi:MAG TPA: tyrosine-type recombinase/integrase [Solirubrobacterales bacterium]|nr:tyrosine-type recombinase/integrase [Solirubrobacterales bacterium]
MQELSRRSILAGSRPILSDTQVSNCLDEGIALQIGAARTQYLRWLRATRDLSPHTLRAYESDLSRFERYVGPRADIGRISRESVISCLESQRTAGLSPASIRRRASAFRGFCRWLLSEGLIEEDPWAGASFALGRSRHLPRVLPAQELDRLLDFLKLAAGVDSQRSVDSRTVREHPHESTTLLAVALMVATGVRVHEVVGFRDQDIDLPGRTMRLVGKGRQGRRERQVFLTNDWITGLTGAYLDARAGLDLSHPRLLFNRHFEPLTPPAMRSRLAKAAAAAGISSRVTPHMLRHTAATQLIEAGVDIRYIQRLLGHASLSTTEIYTHVSDRALRRVVTDADVLGRLTQAR